VETTSHLDGHVCVITGATGIAAAAAHRFVAEGAAVFTIAIDGDECSDLHDALDAGSHHGWAAADLSDETAAVAAFEAVVEHFGTFDTLFGVAGGSGRALHALVEQARHRRKWVHHESAPNQAA